LVEQLLGNWGNGNCLMGIAYPTFVIEWGTTIEQQLRMM
jgi:hypothetical protein